MQARTIFLPLLCLTSGPTHVFKPNWRNNEQKLYGDLAESTFDMNADCIPDRLCRRAHQENQNFLDLALYALT